MTTASSDFMPYAPTEPVLRVIRRLRDRGVPDPINRQALPSLGIAEGNADRVEKALSFLGLIDEEGHKTASFERLGKASTEEFPGVLAEVVRSAYAPILTIVNPGEDSDIAINDAFRPYSPAGQRPRMVALFLGLCREAGMVSGGPVQRQARAKQSATVARPGTKVRAEVQEPSGAPDRRSEHEDRSEAAGLDLRLLSGLIQQLPKEARWNQARRDRWLQAITATVDLLIEIEINGGSKSESK